MEMVNNAIEIYSEEHSSKESELLYQLNRATHLNVLQPRMLSGHLQGRTLSMLSKMIRPKKILEIGTYTGYSALCLAEGLQKEGTLITIDKNEELEGMVKKYFNASPYASQMEIRLGNALEIIPTLDLDFDLVFIDADKSNYLNYYHLIIEKIPKGAFIIADNVLWSGKVVQSVNDKDKDTHALLQFNKTIQEDNRVENVLLPIRDGLMIIQKQ